MCEFRCDTQYANKTGTLTQWIYCIHNTGQSLPVYDQFCTPFWDFWFSYNQCTIQILSPMKDNSSKKFAFLVLCTKIIIHTQQLWNHLQNLKILNKKIQKISQILNYQTTQVLFLCPNTCDHFAKTVRLKKCMVHYLNKVYYIQSMWFYLLAGKKRMHVKIAV